MRRTRQRRTRKRISKKNRTRKQKGGWGEFRMDDKNAFKYIMDKFGEEISRNKYPYLVVIAGALPDDEKNEYSMVIKHSHGYTTLAYMDYDNETAGIYWTANMTQTGKDDIKEFIKKNRNKVIIQMPTPIRIPPPQPQLKQMPVPPPPPQPQLEKTPVPPSFDEEVKPPPIPESTNTPFHSLKKRKIVDI